MKSLLLVSYISLICIIASGSAEKLNTEGLHELEKQECGVHKKDLPFIGNENIPSSRPWMARIKVSIDGKDPIEYIGTVISDQFVLTAAHIVGNNRIDSVRLGVAENSTVEEIDVEKIIMHPDFKLNPITYNDIALVKLDRKVDFKENISPICLPVNEDLQQKVETLEGLLLTGLSHGNANTERNNILREINVSRVDRPKCSKSFRNFTIEPTQICTTLNEIVCKGSSGSPLSSQVEYLGKERFVQIGIVSFGLGDCSMGANTNVASFMPWITAVIGEKPL
ncbi:serine protease grass-like [Drosophila sulfurigaster albostrigata]|uniref:serine protease grass-like n=1 Tax=Drosophila sulfurigaster albostrigata TaxID=89887 RepID=UPI002D21C35C|nr:serine protease grass-like [Drosophila sulfurigaster albostrigata]